MTSWPGKDYTRKLFMGSSLSLFYPWTLTFDRSVMFCIVNSTFLPTESFNLSDFQGSCTSQWVTNLQDEVSDRQTEGGDLSSTSWVTEEKIRDHPKLDFQGSKRTVLKEIMVLGSLFCLFGRDLAKFDRSGGTLVFFPPCPYMYGIQDIYEIYHDLV